MEELETVTFTGSPSYVMETSSRIFKVVKSASIKEKREKVIAWTYEFYEETGELKKGLDIIEKTSRGLSIVVRCNTRIKKICFSIRL